MYIQETNVPFILNFTLTHQQIALTLLSGIGSRRARIIIGHFDDLNEFFSENRLNPAKISGISAEVVSTEHRQAALEEADKVLQHCARIGAQTLFYTHPQYPRRLKACPDAPLLLYSKGQIDWNPERTVAIVGTRHASDYGKELTQELISGLASSGATIISGMAYGIDITAHASALQHNLPTIGVLGHGLHCLYPAIHRKTASRMLHNGGLVSEFAPGLGPEPAHFPMRNRIVAGMSDATIVIESGEKGGSLITANIANDYNRDVFAYPGDVGRNYSLGCLRLIQQHKAHLLIRSEDLIQYMNWQQETHPESIQRSLFDDLSPEEEKIIRVLEDKKELMVDIIAHLASMTVSEVSAHLLSLEFKGILKPLPGKRYSLI